MSSENDVTASNDRPVNSKLHQILETMMQKEKKLKGFKNRLRIKGMLISKKVSKKDNLVLLIEKDDFQYKITILKSHKDTMAVVRDLKVGRSVYAEAIPLLKGAICTRLKPLDKGLLKGKQARLSDY